MKKKINENVYKLDGQVPVKEALPLGLQHVLAMFAGNLTPIIIIAGMCGIAAGSALQITIIQNAMVIAGVVTLIQVLGLGPVGGKLPIVMGTSSGFIGVSKSIVATMGGGVVAYGAILGASLIGGLFEGVLGFFLKPLRRFFPPIVTGTVVLSIGLSLITVGIKYYAGGVGAKDFGSLQNLLIATIVLITIVYFQHRFDGFVSATAILIGIVVGYIIAAIMTLTVANTFMLDGQEVTKSWVLQWHKVKEAGWFSIPKLMPVKLVFDLRAIIPMLIMFIVTSVETIGDVSGITQGGLKREATDRELSGSVMCDGVGSSLASIFGVLPNTSFSQNVGLVGMTGIVNRFVILLGGIFLLCCGFFPKLAAIVSIMPNSVLGGAAVMMFASIAVSGIQLITKEPITHRNGTILIVSLGLGYGLGSTAGTLNHLPQFVQLIFGGSGIVPAALFSIFLNIILPKDKTGKAEEVTI
ncbi:MAG: nucleobase:cation symporter-2 family protein [Sphaerochaetaceae bacterium]|jgi:NCS2 family nucleobase:cation symporter-2|nr:nucleobase:cation symporter-2 family protein [Sphaerochaetaceae bacterium]MDC7236678.1 nucleobase:cation symporter-2 family protein [Sphaerochaetaceae bacterium]MDC7250440.1 nucleobase:cation symporter-2 family protein [Sphaerochaetaceae bacterium]